MFWFPPLLAMAISVVYLWRSPKVQPLSQRLLVSAHGAAIAAIYVCAMYVWWSGSSHAGLALPFMFSLVIPLLLIVMSFLKFQGPRSTHFLQLVNLFCLGATFFYGGMAITGDWL
jgi:hypothetical protein